MVAELTTVADDLVVVHDGCEVYRHDGLEPATTYRVGPPGRPIEATTLPRPDGELLTRFATVNDVHFGEVECGRIDDHPDGPILRRPPGEEPYPALMNRAAVAEIVAAGIDTVFVKGDLTTAGTDHEFAAFGACYQTVFGHRLFAVHGNHDVDRDVDRDIDRDIDRDVDHDIDHDVDRTGEQDAEGDVEHGAGHTAGSDDPHAGSHRTDRLAGAYAGDRWVELPGLTVGLLDTTVPGLVSGTLGDTQLAAIDERVGAATGRVLLLGHHQQWVGADDGGRDPGYFGLHPDASEALDEICTRHVGVIGYAAGHTHRHRVRRMPVSGVPTVEVGCVKDFPGTWAEYRVYEGGVMQVVHRISDPEALAWSNRCRVLYRDFGVDYVAYAMGSLADRCFVILDRSTMPT